jgi:hypothetical protein
MKSFKCDICNTILPDEIRLERHLNVHQRKRRNERASNKENLSVDNVQWPDVSVLAAVNAGLNQIR